MLLVCNANRFCANRPSCVHVQRGETVPGSPHAARRRAGAASSRRSGRSGDCRNIGLIARAERGVAIGAWSPWLLRALWERRTVYAIDAASNALFGINWRGRLELRHVFDDILLPDGTTIDAVPTNMVFGPDGAVYVSTLTGVPFPEGAATIRRWDGVQATPYVTGLTAAIDLGFGDDGSLYVVEMQSVIGLSGRVLRIATDGTRAVVADGLDFPTGIAVGPRAFYVTNHGTSPGIGEVLRFRRPVGEAVATYVFSGPLDYPVSGFTSESRYLLYENGTFGLRYDAFAYVYTGTYRREDVTITFDFGGTGMADATGTLKGNRLEVRYSEMMQHSDFENAVYVRSQ